MSNEVYVGKIQQEWSKAVSKWPEFARRFMPQYSDISEDLARCRALSNKDPYCIMYTMFEEVFEVFEAYAKGEYEHCMNELAQVGAVSIRAMQWLDEQHISKENNNG